jgi:flavin-dependent dehydrogenase
VVVIDVLVAGAGPTGLAAAVAAARAGRSVVVLDPRAGTIDKACGEGLMPAALDALAALGVDPPGHRFDTVRYVRGDVVATGHLPAPGRGVRRTVLHHALDAAAHDAGVRREVGRVEAVVQHADHVEAGGFRARWLVAADGLRSPIRRGLGLDAPAPGPRRIGLRRHFRVHAPSASVDVHWADDAEAYATPVADDVLGVAFLWRAAPPPADDRAPFERWLDRFPELASRLGEPLDEPLGAGPFSVRSSRRAAGRVLLVGDAAGYVDALTGEGLKLGILGARAVVEAIVADDPARWERAWRRLWRPYAWTTAGLLALTAYRPVRRALPTVLRTVPGVMDAVIRVVAR